MLVKIKTYPSKAIRTLGNSTYMLIKCIFSNIHILLHSFASWDLHFFELAQTLHKESCPVPHSLRTFSSFFKNSYPIMQPCFIILIQVVTDLPTLGLGNIQTFTVSANKTKVWTLHSSFAVIVCITKNIYYAGHADAVHDNWQKSGVFFTIS